MGSSNRLRSDRNLRRLGPRILIVTTQSQATYLELKERGVDFIMEPTEMPYGIDAQFHDPSGNKLRFTQSK